MQQDRAYTESLDKLHSVFIEQWLIRSVCVVNFVQMWKWSVRWNRDWKWIFALNVRDIKNSSWWISRPKKLWMSKFKITTMSLCFFDIRGIIQFESVPKGTIVNQTFDMEVLKRHTENMRCKQRELWRDHSLILHHDNTPAHSLLWVSQFLAGKHISATDHPHSPHLAPADFWLFQKLKTVLKRERFSDAEGVKSSV
jgi:hypothetical protein